MYLETLVLDGLAPDLPVMQFFPGASFNGDPTNYWGPNVRCVEAMLGETEFRVERVARVPARALFQCAAVTNPEAAYYLSASDGSRTL